MASLWQYCCVLLLVYFSTVGAQPQTSLPTVDRRIYQPINGTAPCFRLTNATHQIGCSATLSKKRGVLEYVDSRCDFTRVLTNGPTPPYIVLLEPECLTPAHITQLQSSPERVNGLIFRIDNTTGPPKDPFSPERSCPNDRSGNSPCSRPWNQYANDMLFQDYGDLPIMMVPDDQFQSMLLCYDYHNSLVQTGAFNEYPLCSAELTADMYLSSDTPTCLRRESLPINFLSGITFCQNLGDYNVWSTPFKLPSELTNRIIMLTTKMDSVSFFLSDFSYGADSEVPGIVVLLAVIEQIGKLRQNGVLHGTESPIIFSFFNGESWDYIGSSRMVYDMMKGKFPFPKPDKGEKKLQDPKIHLTNISTMLELSQLGIPLRNEGNTTLYLHGASQATSLTNDLKQRLSSNNVELSFASTGRPVEELPPASLQWFLKEGVGENPGFEGYVLAGFNEQFDNKFFGSRFDDFEHLVDNTSLSDVADKLANIATAVAQTVLAASGPNCTDGVDCVGLISANSTLIEELLTCFLVDSNCSLFYSVTNTPFRETLRSNVTMERYVTASTTDSTYTSVIFQLTALYSAFNTTIRHCSACWNMVKDNDQVTNRTAVHYNSTHCMCLESYTHQHTAASPAFQDGMDLSNTDYSTWAESRWNVIQIQMYLVPHYAGELGALFAGLLMTAITLLVAIQCTRRADKLFTSPVRYDLYRVS